MEPPALLHPLPQLQPIHVLRALSQAPRTARSTVQGLGTNTRANGLPQQRRGPTEEVACCTLSPRKPLRSANNHPGDTTPPKARQSKGLQRGHLWHPPLIILRYTQVYDNWGGGRGA